MAEVEQPDRFSQYVRSMRMQYPEHNINVSMFEYDQAIPLEVIIESWGASIYLLPENGYGLVYGTSKDDSFRQMTSLEFTSKSLIIHNHSDIPGRVLRHDGTLVWDDCDDPSQVRTTTQQSSYREALQDLVKLTRSSGRLHRIPRPNFIEYVGSKETTQDVDVNLLIETGWISLDAQNTLAYPFRTPKSHWRR
jgi:hypothetical protein